MVQAHGTYTEWKALERRASTLAGRMFDRSLACQAGEIIEQDTGHLNSSTLLFARARVDDRARSNPSKTAHRQCERGGLERLRVTRRLIWRLHTQRGWWAGMRFENEVERAWARRTGRRHLPRPLRRGGGRHRRSADPGCRASIGESGAARGSRTLPTLMPLQGVPSDVARKIISGGRLVGASLRRPDPQTTPRTQNIF